MILKQLKFQPTQTGEYPFSIALFQSAFSLQFDQPITILIGENGSGKSTLLEGMAATIGSQLIGGRHIDDEPTMKESRKLMDAIQLTWTIRTTKGMFFRANDFINFTHRLEMERAFSQQMLDEIKREGRNPLEAQPYARTIVELREKYGRGLDKRSHGESFLDLFKEQIRPGSLYLLDEPEVPLSPMKQLALMALILEGVELGSQFIIATHSPMLMALPEATLLEIQEDSFVPTTFEACEHVQLTKQFLEAPERYLRHLKG